MIRSGRFSGLGFRDVRCLVVDDEKFSLKAATRILNNLGCREVATAGDGLIALDVMLAASHSFDVVVSDFEMPRMDGLELLKTVRTGVRAVARDISFAMATSHSEKHVVGAAFNLDVDRFILKPITSNGLKARLNNLLMTDRPIKDPIDYESIKIVPDDTVKKLSFLNESDKSELMGNAMNIGVSAEFKGLGQIKENDRLAQDLFAPGGQLLVSKGQLLSERLVDRLRDLAELGVGLDQILIDTETEY